MSATTMSQTTTRRPLLLLVATIIVALGTGLYVSGGWRTAQVVREAVSQPLGSAKSADITIAMGVGRLRIDALDQPGALIAGEIAYPETNRVNRVFAMSGDTASFTLREQDSQRNSLFKYRDDDVIWNLGLAPATPTRLTIEAGIGQSTLDLTKLAVTELDLKTGVGQTLLTLPGQGQVQAHVEGGVGNTTIRVPAGVAVRIALDAGLGTVEVLGNFQRHGSTYTSPDFATAANRVDLMASSGVGTITIQQIGE
jgi:hypothetical protein